jgi:hypothetical protein
VTNQKLTPLKGADISACLGFKNIAPKVSLLDQNIESNVDSSELRRSLFPELVLEIEEWVKAYKDEQTQKLRRQMVFAQGSSGRGLKERFELL